jgi:hypothetical protein
VFYGAAEKYAGILGEHGLAQYRKLAREEWDKVPSLKTDQDNTENFSKRFRVSQIMETLARQSGDIEELVNIGAYKAGANRDYDRAVQALPIREVYRAWNVRILSNRMTTTI